VASYGTATYGVDSYAGAGRLPTGNRVPTGTRLPGGVDVSPVHATHGTFTVGRTVVVFAVNAGSKQTVATGTRKVTLAAGRRVRTTMTAETD
jgi:hypothetical protein